MTKEDCKGRGRACSVRLSVEEEYPVCRRILEQENGRTNDKSHAARLCRGHYLYLCAFQYLATFKLNAQKLPFLSSPPFQGFQSRVSIVV